MGQVVRDPFKFFQIFIKGRRQQEGDARFLNEVSCSNALWRRTFSVS